MKRSNNVTRETHMLQLKLRLPALECHSLWQAPEGLAARQTRRLLGPRALQGGQFGP